MNCGWCGNELMENRPGVDISEAPFWQRTTADRNANPVSTSMSYYCSDECARNALLAMYTTDVGSWAEANFGAAQPAAYCLLGAAEEIGEVTSCHGGSGRLGAMLDLIDIVGRLCHSELKRAQGIRLDEHSVGPDYERELIAAIQMLLDDFDPEGDLGTVTEPIAEPEQIADGVGDTSVYLADYMSRLDMNINLGDAVSIAWDDEVSQREWDADVTVND